jgi:hypothetical protein
VGKESEGPGDLPGPSLRSRLLEVTHDCHLESGIENRTEMIAPAPRERHPAQVFLERGLGRKRPEVLVSVQYEHGAVEGPE